MPKLSIITVNFNNKDGLANTAESVIAQTWTDYEWIIIDGGSTDGSVDVIKEYADKTDKLVYWCSEPDGGIYQGMNKGIEKASGEYCWFLNSGDYAYKNTTLAEIFANEFNEDIVYGNLEVLLPEKLKTEHSDVQHIDFVRNTKKKNKNPYRIIDWVEDQIIPHQASFIKRNLFVKFGLYKANAYRISADTEFFVRLIFNCDAKVKYIDNIFATFISDGISSACSDNKTQKLKSSEHKKTIVENFPDMCVEIFAKWYVRQKIMSLFLPFGWLKYLFVRIKRFGVLRTISYYMDRIIGSTKVVKNGKDA